MRVKGGALGIYMKSLSSDLSLLKGEFDLINIFKIFKYKIDFRKNHPDYFWTDGLLVFCGSQGSGKTLSAVKYVKGLVNKYPKSILVSNVDIHGLPLGYRVHKYTGPEDLSKYNNGEYGVIFLIDEIQVDFNCLESKEISPTVFTEICQQRKQRKTIIGTSQIYGRVAKQFREQYKYAVFCNCFFGLFQWNKLLDGQSIKESDDGTISADCLGRFLWIHSVDDYKSYDTYAKVLKLSNFSNNNSRRRRSNVNSN